MRKILACLALLLCIGETAMAKTWTVNVGGTDGGGGYGGGYNPILAFSPAQITINAGDSITFTNLGGAAHNVHADDNSFRCAAGCDDTGGNGTPSNVDWTFTRTFSTPGTIGYHCDVHASMGMTGTIVVNATTPSITLGGYLSGNWFDPSPNQSGHGFQFEFTAQSNILIAIWFVFTPDGSGPQWVYGQGMFDPNSNTVTVPAAIYSGAKFPPLFNSNDNQQTLWGNLTFTFSDCNHGTASWSSIVPGYGSGSIPIQRITSIEGTACP